jgi:hypothetical protein
MKKLTNPYKFLSTALLLLTATWTFASGDPDVEKKKTYSKTYSLSSNDKVSISNQFGETKILTWSKSEVQVDVTIIGKANSDERAQEIVDRISIEDGKNASGVFFKTKMKNQNQSWEKNDKKGSHNEGMEINYEVHMPASNPLALENQFGKAFVPDMTGAVEISSKFGELTAGKLSNVKKLEIEFGTGTVESVTNGDISIKFSKAQINKMSGAIKTYQSYSGVKLMIDNSVTSLTVKNEFTELMLDVSADLSASYDVYTNFSELRNKTDFKIKEEDEDHHGPKFDHQYSGKSGSATLAIKVKSNFGDVIIGHNLAFDVNDDKEEKKERKERKEKVEMKEKAEKAEAKEKKEKIEKKEKQEKTATI